MKIALLTLPYDNNYGGNLQRYALMKVLQDMGHDVTHIFLKSHASLKWYVKPYSYIKRSINKLTSKICIPVFYEEKCNKLMEERCKETMLFYDKYINHTEPCYCIEDVKRVCKDNYDAYIVGSDQVWRASMTGQLGIENYFLKFLNKNNCKKIAYAASLGNVDPDYSEKQYYRLNKMYKQFFKVSLREESTVEVFKSKGFTSPEPTFCLDPTLLLNAKDYEDIIESSEVQHKTVSKIFCYVLDDSERIHSVIDSKKSELGIDAVIETIYCNQPISIEQWLANIHDADFVITDSYHGTVFSIIFNKQFQYVGNEERGNERVSSLLKSIGYGEDDDSKKIKAINKSIEFLRNI